MVKPVRLIGYNSDGIAIPNEVAHTMQLHVVKMHSARRRKIFNRLPRWLQNRTYKLLLFKEK